MTKAASLTISQVRAVRKLRHMNVALFSRIALEDQHQDVQDVFRYQDVLRHAVLGFWALDTAS